MSPEDEVLAPFVEAMRKERARHKSNLHEPNAVTTWHVVCSCGDVMTVGEHALKVQWERHVEECVLRAALDVEPTKACETCHESPIAGYTEHDKVVTEK